MDKLEPEETKTVESPNGTSVKIERPNNCVIASHDYIEVAVNINCADRSDGAALAEEAREIGKAILSAITSLRNEAA